MGVTRDTRMQARELVKNYENKILNPPLLRL